MSWATLQRWHDLTGASPLEALSVLVAFGVLLVAIVAAVVAYKQVNAFKLFELVKYLQDEGFRASRRVVIREIWEKRATEWWKDPKLEAAASTCAGHYDVVGNLLRYAARGSLRRFVIRSWSESVVRIHTILAEFMAQRRKSGGNDYRDFDWLYKKANHHKKHVGAPWPPLFD